jgi:glutamyl-tRNA reductase
MLKEIFSSKPQQISMSACNIAKKIYGELSNSRLLVVGDNEISFSILDLMRSDGVLGCLKLITEEEKKLFLININKYFFDFDIIITSFKSDKILITKDQITNVLKQRKQKPLFLIDTNIPGNIDSDISKIDNCFLYDLNDLEQFSNDSIKNSEIIKAPETIDEIEDSLDKLIPSISQTLNLDSRQIYLFEEKINYFFKRNSNISEKVCILNFLKSLIKK